MHQKQSSVAVGVSICIFKHSPSSWHGVDSLHLAISWWAPLCHKARAEPLIWWWELSLSSVAGTENVPPWDCNGEIRNTSHICFGLRVLCMSARHKLFFFNNPVSRTLHPLGYKSIFNLVNNARKFKTQWSIYGAPLSFHLNTLILLTLSLNYLLCEYKL